ncbi:RloB domain-containing protein [Candidatus Parcubacteria bacterium]|nr:MAG: RloB domain-containing protein [Candidatus Parcubacteria bacterium]
MPRTPKPSGRRKLPDKGRRPSRRQSNFRAKRRRVLIVCEGEKTEPNYFRRFRGNALEVKVIGTGTDTLDVVRQAKKLRESAKKEGAPYDAVWVVFDKDDFSAEAFNRAIQTAQAEGLKTAYSNQAFELWYVLHFDYMDAAISRRQYREILDRRLGTTYKKNDPTLYDVLLERQPEAIQNAERLLHSYHPEHNPARDDPCTTVHLLVRELNGDFRTCN